MIGQMVHFTLTNRLASSKPVCHPALIMAELPNSKLDLLVMLPTAPPLFKPSVPKGETRSINNWHVPHGDEVK